MTGQGRYLTRMIVFLVVVAAVVALLFDRLVKTFMNNPPLNGVILAVLLFGIIYAFRQIFLLRSEVAWIEAYRRDRVVADAQPRLLAPMATMLGEREGPLRLSPTSMRTLLDGIGARLDESRDISRYMIGLMIFLGLLGTFWGLLETVESVAGVIKGLTMGTGTVAGIFEDLKRGLEAPLSGMGTAFGTSLFGLGGSLVLGFLDLQSGQAQNRFFNDLEDWLSGATRLTSAGPIAEGEQAVPAYIQALLEQTAESIEKLQRSVAQGEESRAVTNNNVVALTERLHDMTEQMNRDMRLLAKTIAALAEREKARGG
ncbi:MAG TPA: flagellar motor protein MotA [Alphaproteobacteria bacterium]|nr:flagellar motor protein MotA [Alphaproteobacteria bacterium]